MNSSLRLRTIPVRVLRRRYGSVKSLSSFQLNDGLSTVGRSNNNMQIGVLQRQQQQPQQHQKINSRQIHSTVVVLKDYPEHQLLGMPALSPTMEMGTISNWELKEGDTFTAGSVFCSVETDKATMDFESQDDGVIAKILKEGADAVDIPVGVPICIVVEEEEDVAAFVDYTLEVPDPPAPAAEATPAAAAADASAPAAATPTDRTVPSEYVLLPSARFLAESMGLDATGLAGTGKGGRVTKGDVLKAVTNGTPMPKLAKKESSTAPAAAAPTTPAPAAAAATPFEEIEIPPVDTVGTYEDVANNNMRKVIAKRLTESKSQVPHFYTSVEVELDNVMKLRKELVSKHDIKVSVNDVIIRCASLALRDVPEANGTYDGKSDAVKLNDTVDISVAVATPTGLITPIVPDTDKLGLSEINGKVRDLAGRAREGKLAPEEYQGGTFCISNLGMFGIDEFSAVINPPQAAILAVGGGSKRIVPTPYVEGAEEQAKPAIKTIMTARLSADRRVVDEATASLFLSAFNHYISKPELLML